MKLTAEEADEMIPVMLISGQMDVSDLANGFDSENLKGWGGYMLRVNGIGEELTRENANKVTNIDSRHPELYTWSKTTDGNEIPMVQWAQCLLRPHNCYPSDMPMLWDFMEHFSFEKAADGTVTRYYSPSACDKDDAVALN